MPPTGESYGQLVDELARAQQKIAQLQAAQQTETEIQHRANCLQAINELTKKLAAATPATDVFALIAETLKTITGAWGGGISGYRPHTRELEVKYVAIANESRVSQFDKL